MHFPSKEDNVSQGCAHGGGGNPSLSSSLPFYSWVCVYAGGGLKRMNSLQVQIFCANLPLYTETNQEL